MQLLLALVGGLGIGTLLTQVVNHFMTRRAIVSDRLYQEKRTSFLGLLDALHGAATQPSNENWEAYVRWQTQCALFGSREVLEAAQKMAELRGGAPPEETNLAFHKLLRAMRVDLGQQAPPVGPA